MRKVFVNVRVKLVINVDDDIEVGKVIEEMEYDFTDTTGKADIEDTEIMGAEVYDSK